MKKKILMISSSVIVLIVIVILIIINSNKVTYRIEVSMVDDHSPDRILTVYNNKNEKIEVNRIEYLDGVLLCNGYNTTVHFGDIGKDKEFRIVLKDNSIVKAKIVEEEVKN